MYPSNTKQNGISGTRYVNISESGDLEKKKAALRNARGPNRVIVTKEEMVRACSSKMLEVEQKCQWRGYDTAKQDGLVCSPESIRGIGSIPQNLGREVVIEMVKGQAKQTHGLLPLRPRHSIQ